MKFIRKTSIKLIFAFFPVLGIGQEWKSNLFIRTPQVVNYDFDEDEITYSPVLSVGAGLSHKSKFVELAALITSDDVYGYYTFFGTGLSAKEVGKEWMLYTNWFGELTYIPKQDERSESLTYTTGLCFFLNQHFEWGSIGFPLCLGLAYNQNGISLNTRTIVNLSIFLN